MLQTLKVATLRSWYRFANWRAWRAANVHDDVGAIELPASGGPLRAHIYRGTQAQDRPMILYFHGGGWVIGDLQTHHAYCSALCRASGATLLAVDYRRAPEHPFPAAQDDSLAAMRLVLERLDDFGPGNGRIVLAGDSAGGHLALCTALAADASLAPQIQGLVLTYPVVDHYSVPYPSYVDCARGQALTSDLMRWFWNTYLAGADPDAAATQRAFPIRSNRLAALPPVLLCTAGRDPLRDEGMALVEALRSAGVGVEHEHYADSEHGFACSLGPTADYAHWLKRCGDWVAAH
jgi:acetyl esterase